MPKKISKVQAQAALLDNFAQQIVDLEARLRTMTERSADTRDNIVRMRERIRDLREQRKYLATKLEEMDEQRNLDAARREAYESGMLRMHEQTVTTLLNYRVSPVTVNIQEPKPTDGHEARDTAE
jgi:chromosome segregation ATPase